MFWRGDTCSGGSIVKFWTPLPIFFSFSYPLRVGVPSEKSWVRTWHGATTRRQGQSIFSVSSQETPVSYYCHVFTPVCHSPPPTAGCRPLPIWSTSERYASYWNAYLFYNLIPNLSLIYYSGRSRISKTGGAPIPNEGRHPDILAIFPQNWMEFSWMQTPLFPGCRSPCKEIPLPLWKPSSAGGSVPRTLLNSPTGSACREHLKKNIMFTCNCLFKSTFKCRK